MGLGSTLNEYDAYIANLSINGSQCTVCWYVDDNKISHKDPKVVNWVINELQKQFNKMTVTSGKEHSFVRMDIVFRNDGKFEIAMKEYLRESIDAFDETISKAAQTPAKVNLCDEDNVKKKESFKRRKPRCFII